MEEIYILEDGTQVDLSKYSDFEKVKFIKANPSAKKKKDTATGASAVSQKKTAPSTGSSLGKSSSGSRSKFRLANDEDFEKQKQTQPNKPTYGVEKKQGNAYEDYYNLKPQTAQPTAKQELVYDEKANREFISNLEKKNTGYLGLKKLKPEEVQNDVNIQNALTSGYLTQDDLVKAGIVQSQDPMSSLNVTSQKDINSAIKKVNAFRTKRPDEIETYINVSKLNTPYIYEDYNEGDDFVSTLFDSNELASRNINLNDFNGFLTEKGYKDDIKRMKELELDTDNYGQGYDASLSLEKRKIQYLNMYINDQIQRDIKRQKLDYEKKTGVDPDFAGIKFKPSKWSANIDLSNYQDLLKKEAPNLTAKMMEVDETNLENYKKLIQSKGNVSAGKFLTDVLGNGWNGLTGAVNDFSASAYGLLPGDYFEGVSESIRENKSIDEMLKGDEFRYVTADGYKTTVNGVQYISNEQGVYDITNKVNVTNILPAQELEKIKDKARAEGVRDKSVSAIGTSYQGANVVGDLIFQLAMTRGTGNGLKAVGGFTEGLGVLGKTKGFLRSVPIKKSIAEATIAQSTLGFSKGYESTLKMAREAGIRDSEAKELASLASIETGAWYAMTAWINPQTKTTDMLFGKSKNEVIENALNAYVKDGKKGFLNSLRGYGKDFLNVSGEGLAEVFQENIQQAGETFVVNKDVNELAGQQLLKDTMSLQDFMDTSVLSFVAGSIIPGAGAGVNQTKKTARQLLGMQGVDRFNSLSTLASNKDKVVNLLSKQVTQGLYTQEQMNDVIGEIDAYSGAINKIPQDISADAAEEILEDITNLSKLEQKKKSLDKSFYSAIDEEMDVLRDKISRTYYDDITSKRTATIKKAIQEGRVGNMEYREFDSAEDLKNVLINEFNYSEKDASNISSNPGFILTEDNLKTLLPEDKFVPGKKVIFINNDAASDMSQFSVNKHEFLHGIIYETIKEDKEAQVLLGRALAGEILNIQQEISAGNRGGVAAPVAFLKRFNQYVTKYSKLIQQQKARLDAGMINQNEYNNVVDTYLGNQWEEVLTLYSDAIDNGSVVFDEDVFTKIGDMIRRVLQRLGIKNVEFNSGKDVYNFVKDYNRSIEKGTFGGLLGKKSSFEKLSTSKANIDKEALRKEVKMSSEDKKPTKPSTSAAVEKSEKRFSTTEKFSLKDDRIDPDVFKKDINSFYNKKKWGSDPNYVDSVTYDILNKYEVTIKQKAKGYGYAYLPDYSSEDMVSETQIALIPVIRNFNKEFFELREEYKKELISKGFKENSKEFDEKLEEQDLKGYKGKKGIVKENNDLNAYINSLLKFKMMDALKTGSVTSKQYNEDIDSEFFKQTNVEGFDYEESEDMLDDIDSLLDEKQAFEQEQSKLAVLLKDPMFGFADEDGNPIDIEIIPFGMNYVQDIDDDIIPANKKLKIAEDPEEINKLKEQLNKLKRGLELESKEELTSEEKEELKALKSFKSFSMSRLVMENTYEAFSTIGKPSKIISEEIAAEIRDSPNVETLEYRNFKEKIAVLATTLSRRMTFKNSSDLESFMYNNWETIYNVINNPTDLVTGESTYTAKKIPPRLKQLDKEGSFIKRKNINRALFLQSYFRDEDVRRIIEKYSENPKAELNELEDIELNENTGKPLSQNAHFDRRTALIEMFGDVLVLQEARRLLRNETFLESVKDRNQNLYEALKDDITRNAILNDMAKGKSDIVKFSLAEENNAKYSTYMDNFSIKDQFEIARILDDAIFKARTISKDPKTFKVPNLEGMNDKAISFYLIDKVSRGYNDFEFLNKDNSKGSLTSEVLNVSDIKFSIANENAEENDNLDAEFSGFIESRYNSNLEIGLNEIIEENKKIPSTQKFSPETAKNRGKNIGRHDIWLPPQDEDFSGLLYRLASAKGKIGEAQKDFFDKHLINPYSDAMLNLMHARQAMYRDWTNLINKKYKGISKRLKKDSGYEGYTIDQAVRVFLWKNAGYEIPGLDAKDVFKLHNLVRTDAELRAFAGDIAVLSKQANGYIEPDHNWGFGTVVGDINNVISKSNRTKFLEQWQHNVDKIFSKDNLSKVEAVYGRVYVNALKNMLQRMKTGSNRAEGSNDEFMNWLNGATGVTMFFNMRSALLQTISASNFINTTDNNVVKIGMRMADLPQFSKDFSELWNSDYLKDRRSGLMNDVAEAELAQVMNDPRNKNVLDKFKAANYWILKQGFLPTRMADSFAIAFGGASFYRNRINTYKKKGLSEEDAKKKAMRDFYETSEVSQQSADVSRISQNQASVKGRLIFAFQNTPLQYNRIIKKSAIDIIKGRGSLINNAAKILYYSTIQNVFFNFMQNALFRVLWDDDDEQKEAGLTKDKVRAANGVLDTLLRGSGMKGVIISTVKNIVAKWYEKHGDQSAGGEVLVEALNISPPIGIKARKLMQSYKTVEWNIDEIKEKGFSIENKYALEATSTITSGVFNIPVDRLYVKTNNVADALNSEYGTWDRIFFALGYNKYNLDVEEDEDSGTGVVSRKIIKQSLDKQKLSRKKLTR